MAQRGRDYAPTDADRKFVERAVMAGSRIEDIASALNIHDDTLRKHFRFEIMTARERMKGEAVRVLMDSLTDGSLDAAKFVLARTAGWSEKIMQEHAGRDGGPIRAELGIDPRKLSTEALREVLAAMGRADESGADGS